MPSRASKTRPGVTRRKRLLEGPVTAKLCNPATKALYRPLLVA